MKKLIKICLIVFGILVGLLFILSLGLTFFLDLNAYKDRIESPIEAALHRQVELGDMSHTLWRGPGIRIQDVTVFEKEQTGTFLNAKNFTVRVELLPLLSQRVEVAKIILDKPEIMRADRFAVPDNGELEPPVKRHPGRRGPKLRGEHAKRPDDHRKHAAELPQSCHIHGLRTANNARPGHTISPQIRPDGAFCKAGSPERDGHHPRPTSIAPSRAPAIFQTD